MNENVTKMFGRTYSEVGSTDCDFIIKTRGQVKIQYGKKYIDIVKDGKLNVENPDIFKNISSLSDIKDNGIYYLQDDNSIYIKIEDQLVKISDGADSTYVSYINQQNTTPEQKQLAQNNIGLVFNTLAEAQDAIVNGFVYLIQEQQFYTVDNGTFTKLSFDIPNPYLKQFVIKREDQNSGGALKLIGDGKSNGISINSSSIYELLGNLILENTNQVVIQINNNQTFVVNQKGITSLVDISTQKDFIGNNIHSKNFQEGASGYRLYYNISTGKSILEVDQIIERGASSTNEVRTYSEGSTVYFDSEGSDSESEESTQDIVFKMSPYLPSLKVSDIIEIQPILDIKVSNTAEDGNSGISQKVPILLSIKNISGITVTCSTYPENSITSNENMVYTINTPDYGDLEIISEDLLGQFAGATFYKVAQQGNPDDPSTWYETFCTDYIHNTISLQQNYVSNGNLIIHKHSIIGNIVSEGVSDESQPHRTWNQGMYSDQSVFSGTVFRFPIEMTNSNSSDVVHFPRYSNELNQELVENHKEVEDRDVFEKVIPTIGWVKNNALKEPLKSINKANLGKPGWTISDEWGSYYISVVYDGDWKYKDIPSGAIINTLGNRIKSLESQISGLQSRISQLESSLV